MPAPNPADIRRLTLANGLNVVLCHEARLKRSAASLRVAVGSHDVPQAWPGLAHFLEHLLFLGTERFPQRENLMTFVQRHGGQVNASTRERTTDFFFELPQARFAQGLERLCDMLAKPRMAMADQRREREVLHAEFIAWVGDAEARGQINLLSTLNPQHPLRGFHAGNRYSLSVPNPAFQRALKDFFQRFYQAGQMTLCLSGPQSVDELEALARTCGAMLASGEQAPRLPPPTLIAPSANPRQVEVEKHLLFACEALPDKADEAAAFLCHWLNAAQEGGLGAELVKRGLADSLNATVLYQFGDQLLLDIEFKGAEADATARNALFFSWLEFFSVHWPALVEEYQSVQQRRLQTGSALALAHHYCRETPCRLSEQGAAALSVLLDQLSATAQVNVAVLESLKDAALRWQLPTPNPFLGPTPNDNAEAAVYLRWTLPSPQPALWRMLDARLKRLTEDARQAGVLLTFSAYGPFWQLQLNGLREPMAAVIEHSLRQLHPLDDETLASAKQYEEPAQIPIRQLLKRLADHYLNSDTAQPAHDLKTIWAHSRWISFVSGFCPSSLPPVNVELSHAPGSRQDGSVALPAVTAGKRWVAEACPSPEAAVLVFCPAPTASIEDEAAWRLLAHLLQAPFYQRLRVELQLGYAVFSSVRQIAGRTGLLFGVQSPTCSAEQLVQHIEAFIDELPELIRSIDLPAQIQALSAQFDSSSMPDQQQADMQWHACLAEHEGDHLSALQSALSNLDTHLLLAAAKQLKHAVGGWLIVANSPVSEVVARSLPEQ
ncbi:pyrroloquinoline quinone biosynthesis protein PqqF [Pseudomonas coronafaciens]|uniref:Coenzyme PQQ synthesis protein F n=1 Tax=Pseudomonas coronafaciens pv. coronafaciens TaxID=235275 RepID=A0AAE6QLX3_9PSED|nr:pyrroloquinoline quinone biosynthesis protein PqqF [Pseudomonas coronafaciens]QGT83993.1 pyrroloquinoline quinone biosynthesis protein PqqF [Pseudomonas coronafaciens pv. coronafaciens]QIQ71833.1 Protease 3 [Pseudomonas coronafaciens]RMM82407.1 Coenzyme PQQ synthesis protein F [Pseudomonas coronafaciens pv. striafaciens]